MWTVQVWANLSHEQLKRCINITFGALVIPVPLCLILCNVAIYILEIVEGEAEGFSLFFLLTGRLD